MLKTARKTKSQPLEELTVSRPELLQDGDDYQFRQFVHDTLAFGARIQGIRDSLAEVIGLSGPQYTILIAVAHEQGDGVGINYIAERLHLSSPFVTIEVKKLVAAKLVSKTTNPTDGRRVLLKVTDKGLRLLEELKTVQRPVNDALFEPLNAEDFGRMRRRMSELVGSADRALKLLALLTTR